MKDEWTSYPCAGCGKTIYRYIARPKPGRVRTYCSPACAAAARYERRKAPVSD